MKIENYEGTADTFTFPTPPNSFDDQGESNAQVTEVPYQNLHIQVGGGGLKPKSIVLQGHLFGLNRNSNYRELAKHFIFEDDKLKKLYFEEDKFYLGYGVSCRKTNSGQRVGFIDYVANFRQLCPVLLSDTQKTADSSNPQTNEGNFYTFIEEITGNYVGSGDVTITDSYGLTLKIPSGLFSGTETVKIKFVYMVDAGSFVKYTSYNYLEIGGSSANGLQNSKGFGSLRIAEGASSSTISISNLSGYLIKFRDGYTA